MSVLPAVRLGDVCTGHDCHPARPNNSASPNVYINGLGAHRVGDSWAPHACPPPAPAHSSVLKAGSPSVFVNGLSLGRVSDPIVCGSVCAEGSPDVFVGLTVGTPGGL